MEIAITSAARIGGQQVAAAAQDDEIEKTIKQEAKGTQTPKRSSRACDFLTLDPHRKPVKIG